LFVIVTLELLEQALFVIVQRKVLAPELRPVTDELNCVGVLTVPAPETVVQAPVPMTGLLPARVAVVTQTDCGAPALDAVGESLTTVTSLLALQPFRLTVQRKLLAPWARLPTGELNKLGVVTTPVPRTDVQEPVPVPGCSPSSVAVLAQTVWLVPAEIAKELLVTTTSSSRTQALFVMVHLKVFGPELNAVTVVLNWLEAVIVAAPVTRVQRPVPIVGMLPASVAVVPQTGWSAPAVAAVGRSFVTFTSSLAAQPFCVTVQRSVFRPGLSEPSALLKAVGVEMLAEPTTMVQRPVPVVGAVPAKVAAVLHTVWSTPAVTVKALLLTTTSSKYEHALFVIVQRKVFVPEPRPVTAEL